MFQIRAVPTSGSFAIIVAVLTFTAALPARAGHDAELDDLQMVLEALEAASHEIQLEMLAAGLGEVARTHGWEGSCGDALWTYARAPYDLRTAQVAAALEDCPVLCPSPALRGEVMLRVAAMPEGLRTGIVASACDAEGPDPVFGGDLAPLRAQMPLVEYWAFRAGFTQLEQRLDQIGGERAAAIGVEYREVIGEVAARLSLYLPPPQLAQRLPATTSMRPAQAPTSVVATKESVSVHGEIICSLTNGAVSEDQLDGRRIPALANALEGVGESALLQIDRDLTSELLIQVLTSGAVAGITRFELAGLRADGSRQAVISASIPLLAGYLGTSGMELDSVPLNLAVVIDESGYRLAGSASVLDSAAGAVQLPTEDGEYPYASLTELLSRIKEEYPDEDQVNLVLDAEVPYHVVVSTLDACRGPSMAESVETEYLFPHAVVAVGVGQGLGSGGGKVERSATGMGAFGGAPVILGALDKTAISDEVHRHLAQIRFCYQRELTKQPALSGKVVLKFVIANDGTVSSVDVKETTLAQPDVESCLCDVTRRMEFPEPRGGGICIVSYPFIFKPAE